MNSAIADSGLNTQKVALYPRKCEKCSHILKTRSTFCKHKKYCGSTRIVYPRPCPVCKEYYATRSSFHSHKKFCIALGENIDLNKTGRTLRYYSCNLCGLCLSKKEGIENHTKSCSQKLNKCFFNCTLPGCKKLFTRIKMLHRHMIVDHHVDYGKELKFDSMLSFKEWLESESIATFTSFTKFTGAKKIYHKIHHFYFCHLTARKTTERISSRRNKKGTLPTNINCPVRIYAVEEDCGVNVFYYSKHNHEMTIENYMFHSRRERVRNTIKENLSVGVTEEKLKEILHNEAFKRGRQTSFSMKEAFLAAGLSKSCKLLPVSPAACSEVAQDPLDHTTDIPEGGVQSSSIRSDPSNHFINLLTVVRETIESSSDFQAQDDLLPPVQQTSSLEENMEVAFIESICGTRQNLETPLSTIQKVVEVTSDHSYPKTVNSLLQTPKTPTELTFDLYPSDVQEVVEVTSDCSHQGTFISPLQTLNQQLITFPNQIQVHKMLPKSIATFVFFDLEITGLGRRRNTATEQITQVSMVAVDRRQFCKSTCPSLKEMKPVNKLIMAMKPRSFVSSAAGRNSTLLRGEAIFDKNISQMIVSFLSLLTKPACLLAHNGQCFDFPVLRAELRRNGMDLPDGMYIADTLLGLKAVDVENLPPTSEIETLIRSEDGKLSLSLENLHAYFFNDQHQSHQSSEEDCIVLAKICHQMKNEIVPWIDENCVSAATIDFMW